MLFISLITFVGVRNKMRKEILGILVMMLLISTAIPVMGFLEENEKNFEIQDYVLDIKIDDQKDTASNTLDQLDQYQTSYDNEFLIGNDNNGYRLAQSFRPTLPKLTRFSVMVCTTVDFLNWHYNYYHIAIKHGTLTSADILSFNFPTSQLQMGEIFWLTISGFSPVTVTPGDYYYIVIYGLEGAFDSGAEMNWHYQSGSVAYLYGEGYIMDQPDTTWWPIFGGGDFCFKTYGTSETNNPPNTPSQLSGPSSGNVGQTLTYTSSATDQDGDTIKYGFDGNMDGVVDLWSSSYYASGATYTLYVSFTTAGTYNIRLKAQDEHGAESGWSTAKTVTIGGGGNNPPNTPNTPSGPTTGSIGASYSYSTSGIDPDSDQVKYCFDWGDTGIHIAGHPWLVLGALDLLLIHGQRVDHSR